MTGGEVFAFLDLVNEFQKKAKDLKEKRLMTGEVGVEYEAKAYEDAAKSLDTLLRWLCRSDTGHLDPL